MPNTTVYTNNQYYQNIAAAIRSKNGQSTLYKPSEMGPAINALVVSGESVRLQAKTVDPITTQQNITADAGYHGLSAVTIGAIQTETKTITENGTYIPIANHFFSNIVVNVTGDDLPDGDLLAYGSTPKQTIWEGTFTGEHIERIQAYRYQTNDLQNCELLKNISEVVVTFDGVAYTLPVESLPGSTYGFMVGSSDPSFSEYPFMFLAMSNKSLDKIEIVNIYTQTAGQHTIKVEYTPSPEPAMQTIWEGTFDATYSEDVGGNYYTTQDIQNGELIKNCNEVAVTFDGTTYTLPVEQTPFGYGVGDDVEPSSDHPFVLAFMVESPSSAVLKTLAIFTLTEGEHTIKVEGAPSGNEPSGDTMRVLYDGEVTGGTVKGDFVYKNAFLSELASMADYTQATITVNNESKTILPVNEVQGDYGKNYILGMDAYPPTELPHDVGVAVVYEVNGKDPTSGGSYSSYIITPSRSKGTQVTSLKVEVDENNKRGDR